MKLNNNYNESYIETQLDELKKHPFSLRRLEKIARDMTGDPDLNVRAGKGDTMSYSPKSNTLLIPMSNILKKPSTSVDGLVILGTIIHELKGHYNHTYKENFDIIVKKSKEDGIPANIGLFLLNCIEDPRVNQIIIDEEQKSQIIDYLYDRKWQHYTLKPPSSIYYDEDQYKVPLYKQLGYNIIYFWLKGKFYPDTDPEIKKALTGSIEDINKIIYSKINTESDPIKKKEIDFKRSIDATKTLVGSVLWEKYCEFVKQDILNNAIDNNSEQGDMDMDDTEDLPDEFKDTYSPLSMESKEGEDKKRKPIFRYEPPLRGVDRYCTTSIGEIFNQNTLQWDFNTNFNEFTGADLYDSHRKLTFILPEGKKLIPIALPNTYSIDTENIPEYIDIKRGSNGIHYMINNGEKTEIAVAFGQERRYGDSYTSNCLAPIHTEVLSAETEDLLDSLLNEKMTNIEKSKKIKTYIASKKGYNVKYQKSLKDRSRDTNEYIRNIDLAPEIECYTAALFGISLCRSIGIPARLNGGYLGKTSKNTTTITRSDGHAWAEIWSEESNSWVIVDFTPPSNENKEKSKNEMDQDAAEANSELESNMTEIDEKEKNDQEDRDYKDIEDNQNNNSDNIDKTSKENIKNNSKNEIEAKNYSLCEDIYNSAMENYVEKNALEIIEALEEISSDRERKNILSELFKSKTKTYTQLDHGDNISADPVSMMNLVLQGRSFYSKDFEKDEDPIEEIKMFDCEFVITIDCSGSMGRFSQTSNFVPQTALDDSFLQTLSLATVCAHFNMPFHIVLFADNVHYIDIEPNEWFTPDDKIDTDVLIKEFIMRFMDTANLVGCANEGNSDAINKSIDILEGSTHSKKLILLVSDGDVTDSTFFDNEGQTEKNMRDNNIYLAALGYGAASEVKESNLFYYRRLTFIESRFHRGLGDPSYGLFKGIPFSNFQRSAAGVKHLLFDFINEQGIPELTTFDYLPDYLE